MGAKAGCGHRRSRATTTAAAVIGVVVALTGCSSTTAGNPLASGPASISSGPASMSSEPVPVSSGPTPVRTSDTTSSTSALPIRGAAFLDPQAVHTVLTDAASDIVAANSYDYRHLAEYRRTALATTTGAFTQTLANTIDDLIAKNAPKLHAQQTAKVNRVGIADMDAQDATVLIFGQLAVRNTTYPSGRTDPFEAVAGLRQVQQHWLLTRIATAGRATCDPPGTAALSRACANAGAGAAAITTYRRSTFEHDFQRTTSMLTGQLLIDVRSKERATRRTMLNGGFDLRGVVLASAAESAAPDQVEILVALNGYRSTSNTPIPEYLEVTVKNVGGRWLLSDVRNIGGS